jgi:hypothetical protein
MSELSARPGFLSPEAVRLIDGQYADRPHLRPVVDAVLAAAPALGAVTVEARRTLVSLVTPRRTFAVVQATTKNRVDLGLRLEGPDAPPAGARVRPAKNLGPATVRVPLTEAADFDAEALGWLRLAYEQNTGPAPPRRKAAPRPKPEPTALTLVIEGTDLLGRSSCAGPDGPVFRNVHLAVRSTSKDRQSLSTPGHPWRATEPVPGDAPGARWEIEVTLRRTADGLDFGGPFVRGDQTDRHIGLVWGDVRADGTFRLIHGAKLKFAEIDRALIEQATSPGSRLVARIRFTDPRGPVWSVAHP